MGRPLPAAGGPDFTVSAWVQIASWGEARPGCIGHQAEVWAAYLICWALLQLPVSWLVQRTVYSAPDRTVSDRRTVLLPFTTQAPHSHPLQLRTSLSARRRRLHLGHTLLDCADTAPFLSREPALAATAAAAAHALLCAAQRPPGLRCCSLAVRAAVLRRCCHSGPSAALRLRALWHTCRPRAK